MSSRSTSTGRRIVTPVLSTMSPATAAKIGRTAPHHRLMVLVGSGASPALVVPSMTSGALAMMVLRQAAARHIPE